MRVEHTVTIDAPLEAVWERVSDPRNWPRELGRMRCAHVEGTPETGVGARYRLHIQVGATEVGSLIEVIDYEPTHSMGWTAITGLEQSGYWHLRTLDDGRSEVILRVRYQAAGGVAALVTDEVSARLVGRYVADALRGLARRCEGAPPPRRRRRPLSDAAFAARVLAVARIVPAVRPDRAARALAAVARWGQTPAAAYVAAAALYPNEPAVIDEAGSITFAELNERTNRLAWSLLDEGIAEGDSVAVLCRNHRGFVETLVALSKLGADALLLNTGFAGPQLVELLEREKPAAIVLDDEFSDRIPDDLKRRSYVAWGAARRRATLERLIDAGEPSDPVPPARHGRTTILTSGTTGAPKGASRAAPGIDAAVAILSMIPLRARERVLVSAPLFHQWGFAHFGLGQLLASTLVLRRRFDPEDALATIARERVSCWAMVPVMCQRILELPDRVRRSYDTSSLRTVPVSGSALAGDLALRFMDEFGDVLYNLYGSTEVAWVAIASPKDLRRAPGTVGRAPRGTIVRVLDERGGQCRAGQTGRIFVFNDMLFEGYSGGGSKEVIDGLMATGDVGHFDDHGRLFVDGRDDDMIVSGGENVFPQEVEETLARHAGVREAAVVGVDDERFGQRLKAFVVVEGSIDERALKEHVKSNLAGFKVPREIEFVDELPRSEQGKVLKRELEPST
jgi:acyl-CoA synthetase (AMP-forming)/AMP-acid ligase II/uncharacterized protein YndB with AHSA1/START domain